MIDGKPISHAACRLQLMRPVSQLSDTIVMRWKVLIFLPLDTYIHGSHALLYPWPDPTRHPCTVDFAPLELPPSEFDIGVAYDIAWVGLWTSSSLICKIYLYTIYFPKPKIWSLGFTAKVNHWPNGSGARDIPVTWHAVLSRLRCLYIYINVYHWFL